MQNRKRPWPVVFLGITLAAVVSCTDSVNFATESAASQQDPSTQQDFVGLYETLVLAKASGAETDVYVALREDGEFNDPPEALFSRLPENFFPLSAAVGFEFPGRIVSHRTNEPAKLIYIDLLRLEPPRHYVLLTEYRTGLGSETSFVTVVSTGDKWLVAVECPVWMS